MKPIGMPSFNKISFDKPPLDTLSLDNDSLQKDPDREVVFGYSQSASVANQALRDLDDRNSPAVPSLSFVLAGNPNGPNGGLLERFPGLALPPLGLEFPSIETLHHHDLADFPQMPLSLVGNLDQIWELLQRTPGSNSTQGDAVTISPEAQAAADLLDPVD